MPESWMLAFPNVFSATVQASRNLRYYIILIWAATLWPIAGFWASFAWGSATLGAGILRSLIEKRLLRTTYSENGNADTADPRYVWIVAATNVAWAAAAVIAWFSATALAKVAAGLYLAGGCTYVLHHFRSSARQAAIAGSPYACVAFALSLDGALSAHSVAMVSGVIVAASAFVVTSLQSAKIQQGVWEAQRGNALLLEQVQVAMETAAAVPWEIDVEHRCIRGLDRIAPLHVQDFTYESFSEGSWNFAIPADRLAWRVALLNATVERPRLLIEYRVVGADGALRWIRTVGQAHFAANRFVKRYVFLSMDVHGAQRSRTGAASLCAPRGDFAQWQATDARDALRA